MNGITNAQQLANGGGGGGGGDGGGVEFRLALPPALVDLRRLVGGDGEARDDRVAEGDGRRLRGHRRTREVVARAVERGRSVHLDERNLDALGRAQELSRYVGGERAEEVELRRKGLQDLASVELMTGKRSSHRLVPCC